MKYEILFLTFQEIDYWIFHAKYVETVVQENTMESTLVMVRDFFKNFKNKIDQRVLNVNFTYLIRVLWILQKKYTQEPSVHMQGSRRLQRPLSN